LDGTAVRSAVHSLSHSCYLVSQSGCSRVYMCAYHFRMPRVARFDANTSRKIQRWYSLYNTKYHTRTLVLFQCGKSMITVSVMEMTITTYMYIYYTHIMSMSQHASSPHTTFCRIFLRSTPVQHERRRFLITCSILPEGTIRYEGCVFLVVTVWIYVSVSLYSHIYIYLYPNICICGVMAIQSATER